MPLLVFLSGSKRFVFKLGRFSYAFAENTNEMSLGNGFRWREDRFLTIIYTLSRENQAFFPHFLILFEYRQHGWRRMHPAASERRGERFSAENL